MLLAEVTHTTFLKHVRTKFTLRVPPASSLEAELIEVTPLVAQPGQKRAPFSLIFRVPGNIYLKQHIYKLEHTALGELDIFLVPIGPDSQGMRLEAIFN